MKTEKVISLFNVKGLFMLKLQFYFIFEKRLFHMLHQNRISTLNF